MFAIFFYGARYGLVCAFDKNFLNANLIWGFYHEDYVKRKIKKNAPSKHLIYLRQK